MCAGLNKGSVEHLGCGDSLAHMCFKLNFSVCVCEIEGQRLLEYCCTEDWEMQHVFPLIRSQLGERERGREKWEGGKKRGVQISRYINVSYFNINTRVTRREMKIKPSVIMASYTRAICREVVQYVWFVLFAFSVLRNMNDLPCPTMQLTWPFSVSYDFLYLILDPLFNWSK